MGNMGNIGRISSLAPRTIMGVGALTLLGVFGALGAFFAMDQMGLGADISGLALAGCCGTYLIFIIVAGLALEMKGH